MGLLIAPLSCSPSSLQEGATLVHAAVLGNQVIPRVGRRHLPLPVSTACGLCSPLPLVLRAGDVSLQLGSGEGRVSARLSQTLASSCQVAAAAPSPAQAEQPRLPLSPWDCPASYVSGQGAAEMTPL